MSSPPEGLPRIFDVSTNDTVFRKLTAVGNWSLWLSGPIIGVFAALILWQGLALGPVSAGRLLVLFAVTLFAVTVFAVWGATLTFGQPLVSVEVRKEGFRLVRMGEVVASFNWVSVRRPISISCYESCTGSPYSRVPCILTVNYQTFGLSLAAANSLRESARGARCKIAHEPKQGLTKIWAPSKD